MESKSAAPGVYDGNQRIDGPVHVYLRGSRAVWGIHPTVLTVPNLTDARSAPRAVKAHEVLIQVRACGFNSLPAHVDILLSKPPKLRELREALARCCD